MRRFLIVFMIVFIIISFSTIAIAQSNILLGFWNFSFPISSRTWGYLFLEDGRFIYYDASQVEGYYGTLGKWKELKNRVYLLPEKDLMNNNNSYYALKSSYQDWQLVTDLRSVNNYWYSSDKDDSGYPPSLSIKIFKDRKITPYVRNYCKLYNLEGVKKQNEDLIRLFEETVIKK